MPRPLVDLLWRDHPLAPAGGSRGPRARLGTGQVVERAVAMADDGGLAAVTIRSLGQSLGVTGMSVYTYVNSRDDLLVLMADHVHFAMQLTALGAVGWQARVRQVAQDNLALFTEHPWLLEVEDPRTALGPGTIAKYDHELLAFEAAGLADLDRDASLSFVLDFVRASAARLLRGPGGDFTHVWRESVDSLANYLGEDHPLAQRVGRVAGEAMGAPSDAARAWEFGLVRVIAGLEALTLGEAPGDG
ncbi:TetR/AcrR family transcriptional regulator [Propionibacteriaceae bacterium Y1923]